ncbi:hypothetical protein BGZ47_002718 [Haplosporangium gracile]|nr:hypothetical protein BGZ47_002718 [Haplosporangium gracile]
MATLGALRSRKLECHDDPNRRIYPLKRLWCLSHFLSRTGLSKHLIRCKGLNELSYPWKCPHCGHRCAAVGELCAHSRAYKIWEQDTNSDNETLVDFFEKELIHVVKHAATARCSQEMFEPAELRVEDGSKAFTLLLASGSKKL